MSDKQVRAQYTREFKQEAVRQVRSGHLRFRWEVFAAIFTSDTIAEATQLHQ